MKGVSHFVHDHGVGPSWLNCWAAVIMRQAQQGRAEGMGQQINSRIPGSVVSGWIRLVA